MQELISRIGASVPPGGARRQREPPGDELADGEGGERADREAAGEDVVDHVVADAERAGHEQAERREPSAPMIGCQNSPTGSRR